MSAVADIGGSVVSGVFADDRLGRGTDAAISSRRKANALYKQSWNDTRADFGKFLNGGTEAWTKMLGLFGIGTGGGAKPDGGATSDFLTRFVESSPDYKFAKGEMIDAADKSASANGRLFSGGYAKELQERAGGLASTQLNNVLNRMMSFAGVGMNAADTLGRFRKGYADSRAGNMTDIGDLKLGRQLGQADIFSSTMGDVMGSFGGGGGGGGGGNFGMTPGDIFGSGWTF